VASSPYSRFYQTIPTHCKPGNAHLSDELEGYCSTILQYRERPAVKQEGDRRVVSDLIKKVGKFKARAATDPTGFQPAIKALVIAKRHWNIVARGVLVFFVLKTEV